MVRVTESTSFFAALVLLLAVGSLVRAAVSTTGDVSPGGAGTQPDPWMVEGTLTVGVSGDGTLNIESGGVVTNSDIGIVGYDFDSTGEVTVAGTGSQWTNSDLYVGDSGVGELNVTYGGVVSSADSYLGYWDGSTGKSTVSGTGSQWTISGYLSVGEEGNGTLNIQAGGIVSGADSSIGYDSNSAGEATVTGIGSQWIVSGYLLVGDSGSGMLNVADGGVVSNSIGSIGYESGSTGEVSVAGTGSQWTNSDLYVGDSGVGALNVIYSGVVSGVDSYIGYWEESTGEVTVSGTGSQWISSGYLSVGEEGNGTLNVQAGGLVSSTDSYIGGIAGSIGLATVSGIGSQWTSSGFLSVGEEGNGTLNVQAGGLVSSIDGYIGGVSDSTGLVTVSGIGSQWSSSGTLYVGDSGAGTLNIHDGGLVVVDVITEVGGGGTINVHGGQLSGAGGINAGRINILPAGEAIFLQGLTNQPTGQINNSGGSLAAVGTIINTGGGSIGGFGQFSANGGWTNSSMIMLNGPSHILGDFTNADGGQVVTSGGATTTFANDVIHNGSGINTAIGSTTTVLGVASGSGAYIGGGTAHFVGALQPGNSSGAVSFEGNVILGTSSTTQIELGGTAAGAFDQLNVSGSVSLAATLDAILIDGFSPSLGDTFTIITADGGVMGTFDTVNVPSLDRDIFLDVVYHPTSVVLGVILNSLLGDANNDSQVTGGDLIAVQQNFAAVYPSDPSCDGQGQGDANDDCLVTGGDLIAVQQNFGHVLNPASGSIPEPGTLVVLVLGWIHFACCRGTIAHTV